MEEKIKEFIGEDTYYDNCGHIFGVKGGNYQKIANVSGWGAIQNMFKNDEDAEKFQDELGQFIADAIKEKVNRKPEKFAIIGSAGIDRTTLAERLGAINNNQIVMVDPKEPSFTHNNFHHLQKIFNENSSAIFIGGKKYEKVAKEKRQDLLLSSYGEEQERKRPKVDVFNEYMLILRKESKLSRSDREWVKEEFHKLYKEKE